MDKRSIGILFPQECDDVEVAIFRGCVDNLSGACQHD